MAANVPRVPPQHVLAVYVEPLAIDKRVVVLGDASLGLGARLLQLGARAVELWDPDVERALREARTAPRGVVVHPFGADATRAPSDAFELAIVPDLSVFEDAEELVAQLRDLVGGDGAVLVATAAREAEEGEEAASLDYYELFDLVAREFEEVRMIAQLPFRGLALAELGEHGEDAPAVTVDTQLADTDREPEAYLALGSQRGVRLDPYAIVELPIVEPPAEPAPPPSAQLHANLRAEALDAQVVELRGRLADAERRARAVPRLEEALRERSERAAEIETLLAERLREGALRSEELERLRAAVETQRFVASEIEELAERAQRAERALASSETELARLGESGDVELVRYEAALRERAQVVARLEAELVRRERLVRELVDAMEEQAGSAAHRAVTWIAPPEPEASEAKAPRPAEPSPSTDVVTRERDSLADENVTLRHKLDALALELARREGEAQASAWSVAELERRVAAVEGAPAHPVGPSGDDRLAEALDELDVLRRALAQEHDARLRAESGEELLRARAEIEKQAARLDELEGLTRKDETGARA